MPKPTKTRQARQAALREELQSREYLRQIHGILASDWQPENVSVNTAKMNGYFRLLAKSLPDCKELPVVLEVDQTLPLAQRAEAVASAAIAGTITPTEANALLNVMGRVAEIKAVHELEARILKLELLENDSSD
ncbi:hypothetical protein [Thiothrix subterranea]|uniref:Uncharacterized protein n=1 Tax=Thiothrix subterranea TaxID=2735563 RepID=A0AA51MN32_9GAMM|nr:hypothetical protein [Thiothrix subterranea]MDQ5770832.1 hypothetical protein [Thiothrix subterranea]WML87250.1 hypothetical protein RCG00_02565 [Thiothrix subterranea]